MVIFWIRTVFRSFFEDFKKDSQLNVWVRSLNWFVGTFITFSLFKYIPLPLAVDMYEDVEIEGADFINTCRKAGGQDKEAKGQSKRWSHQENLKRAIRYGFEPIIIDQGLPGFKKFVTLFGKERSFRKLKAIDHKRLSVNFISENLSSNFDQELPPGPHFKAGSGELSFSEDVKTLESTNPRHEKIVEYTDLCVPVRELYEHIEQLKRKPLSSH